MRRFNSPLQRLQRWSKRAIHRGDRPDPGSNEEAFAYLTIAVRDADQQKVGRRFSGAAIEMALASYPGFTGTGPPGDASQVGVFWPALVSSDAVAQIEFIVIIKRDDQPLTFRQSDNGVCQCALETVTA